MKATNVVCDSCKFSQFLLISWISCFLLVLAVAPPVRAGGNLVLDQAQESDIYGGVPMGGLWGRGAQTFTVGLDGTLAQVDLELDWFDYFKTGNQHSQDLNLRILGTTTDGRPDDVTVLGTAVIPGTMLEKDVRTWVSVDLTSLMIEVSTGDVLTIEVSGPDPVSWTIGKDYLGGRYFTDLGPGWKSNYEMNPLLDPYDMTFRTFVIQSQPPTADAGLDRIAAVGDGVVLNGGASTDDQTPANLLGYAWSILSKPSGSISVVTNDNLQQASLEPDMPGDYVIQLVVTDEDGNASVADQVVVTAELSPAFIFTRLASGGSQYHRDSSGYSSANDYFTDLDFQNQSVTGLGVQSSYSFDYAAGIYSRQYDSGAYRLTDSDTVPVIAVGDPGITSDSQFTRLWNIRNIDQNTLRLSGATISPTESTSGTFDVTAANVTRVWKSPIMTSDGDELTFVNQTGASPDLVSGGSSQCVDTATRTYLYWNGSQTVTYTYCARYLRGVYRMVGNVAQPLADNTQSASGVDQLINFYRVEGAATGVYFTATFQKPSGARGYGIFRVASDNTLNLVLDTTDPAGDFYRGTITKFAVADDGTITIGGYRRLGTGSETGIFGLQGSTVTPLVTNHNSPAAVVGESWGHINPQFHQEGGVLSFSGTSYNSTLTSYSTGLFWYENGKVRSIAQSGKPIGSQTYDSYYFASYGGRRAIDGRSLVFGAQKVLVNEYDSVTGTRNYQSGNDVLLARFDTDRDQIGDDLDNCPSRPNPDQLDSNGNGIGDLCEDSDADGVFDDLDNCPSTANVGQADTDADGIGDACDVCPNISDPLQADADDDGMGDFCDADMDDDGFDNNVDNCPAIANDQANLDGDSLGDACDLDIDGDGIGNVVDGHMLNGSFVDESRIVSKDFSDQNIGGVSHGSIQTASGLELLVDDAADSADGLMITSGSGTGTARLKQCDFNGRAARIDLLPDSRIVITCGSIGIKSLANRAFLFLDDDVLIDAAPQTSVLVRDTGGPGFIVTNNPDSGQPVDMMLGDVKVSVDTNTTGTIEPSAGGDYKIAVDSLSTGLIVAQKKGVAIAFRRGQKGIPVLVDLKPDDLDNTVNLRSKGVVDLAILGDAGFDATDVDPASVKVGGAAARVHGKGKTWFQVADVNDDSRDDMVVQVRTAELDPSVSAGTVDVEGMTNAGDAFRSSTYVRVVPD